MIERYRLPEVFGTREIVMVSREPGGIIHGRVFLDDGRYGDVAFNEQMLIKVEPPEPPEPAKGSVVIDGDGTAWQRGYEDWMGPEGRYGDWAHLCEISKGMPVRLVPDPAAGVELPWGVEPRVWVDETPTAPPMVGVRYGDKTFWLKPGYAREFAGAVLAAADAAERGTSA